MRRPDLIIAAAAAMLFCTAGAAAAQQMTAAVDPGNAAPAAAAGAPAANEPRLMFDREVFTYRGRARRDPFQPLTTADTGPLFADLKLHMILYSEDRNESVVSISDGAGKQYRLRRGETVGNATVVDIAPGRVVFSVMDFGIRRQEILNLKEGA